MKRRVLRTLVFLWMLVLGSIHCTGFAETGYSSTYTIVNPEDDSNIRFGCTMAVNDEYIFVGSEYAERDGLMRVGKVYQFDHEGNPVQSLESTDWGKEERFGSRVIANEERVLVTESELGYAGKSTGQVYLFDSNGGFLTKIDSPEVDEWAEFGTATWLLSDKMLISEPKADTEYGTQTGRVHVFDYSGNYVETHHSPEPKINSGFGFCIAANEDIIVVSEIQGVLSEQVYVNGLVHVFDHDWNHLNTLTYSDPEVKNVFGWSLAVTDDHIVIGNIYAQVDDLENVGEVYIYSVSGEHVNTIQPPSSAAGTYFGECLLVHEDALVVGTPKDDSHSFDSGKVYIYSMEGTLLTELESPDVNAKGFFGDSIAAVDDKIIVGASGENKVYVFSKGASSSETTTTEETVIEEAASEEEQTQGIPGFPVVAVSTGMMIIILWFRKSSGNSLSRVNSMQVRTQVNFF